MANPSNPEVKSKFINVRVDPKFGAEITEYCKDERISLGHLTRWALQEYMWAHPARKEPDATHQAVKEVEHPAKMPA